MIKLDKAPNAVTNEDFDSDTSLSDRLKIQPDDQLNQSERVNSDVDNSTANIINNTGCHKDSKKIDFYS